jgi:hypothetical protein
MASGSKILRRRLARRQPAGGHIRGRGGSAREASPVESPAIGQLIDLTEWRLLRPVDPCDDGAA